ncbi:MFS transporter [Actinomadura violacea]|uniref:MFS transporter n=1 Tax=Actinomadura violacea TaxID=2819934 RepID=A0ABS3RNT5_9ACTN|nr:MFS transporter [Actinomadura violacea]MBO2458398.1 MFS transporter [Actinomadura violacea]
MTAAQAPRAHDPVPGPGTPPDGDTEQAEGRTPPGDARPEPRPPEAKARSGVRRDRLNRFLRHPVTLVTAVAAVLHLLWLATLASSGGDLAAQDAWAEFAGRHPGSAYNLAWYGGMHPVSYSAVSPYVMSLLGVRTTMILAGTASSALLAVILTRSGHVRKPIWASLAGVVALLCNAISGRVTFGLGLMFAIAAAAVVFSTPRVLRGNRWAKAAAAGPLAGLATACSPVAGLYIGLVAAALFLQKRRPAAYALGVAPVVVVALSAWLFPFSGTQPMPLGSAILPIVFGITVILLVPKQWRTVRITSVVTSAVVLFATLITSQIGTNITRLPMLFTGVVLIAALPFTEPRSRKWYAIVLVFLGFTTWIGIKTVQDVVRAHPAAAWTRRLAPLVHELRKAGAERGRVEVVPARSHREASALAPYVNLARGWNRQADIKRNPLFYDGTLTVATYHDWLKHWAVHYVVLPADAPDDGAERERELVGSGLPYLKKVWSDSNWHLYAVTDPAPLAEPHATVLRAEQNEMTLKVGAPGRILIRIPYSPWLGLVDGEGHSLQPPFETEASKQIREYDGSRPPQYENPNGCLAPTAPDATGEAWTELLAPKAGTYRLAAPYKMPRGTSCPKELRGPALTGP